MYAKPINVWFITDASLKKRTKVMFLVHSLLQFLFHINILAVFRKVKILHICTTLDYLCFFRIPSQRHKSASSDKSSYNLHDSRNKIFLVLNIIYKTDLFFDTSECDEVSYEKLDRSILHANVLATETKHFIEVTPPLSSFFF